MKIERAFFYLLLLIFALVLGAYFFALTSSAQSAAPIRLAQTVTPQLQPDIRRVLGSRAEVLNQQGREGGYVPAQERTLQIRQASSNSERPSVPSTPIANFRKMSEAASLASISPGTPLSRVLHTSQLSLISAAGSNEEFVDTKSNLISDQRTTFDNAGGSFDIAVGQSGAR